jgi:hypothetical protein
MPSDVKSGLILCLVPSGFLGAMGQNGKVVNWGFTKLMRITVFLFSGELSLFLHQIFSYKLKG